MLGKKNGDFILPVLYQIIVSENKVTLNQQFLKEHSNKAL